MDEFFAANPPGISRILRRKTAFIAGAGGLGSNVAIMLARAGLGALAVADFDNVSPSNMNRQQFTRAQMGMPKTKALAENIRAISPELRFTEINKRLEAGNLEELIPAADIIFGCFDRPSCKAELVRFCLSRLPETPLIAVSGLAGMGPVSELKIVQRTPNFYLVGDESSDVGSGVGTISSRVILVAAMQAHVGLRLLCGLPAL